MKIVWSEGCARQIAAHFERLREQLRESFEQSDSARAALDEANPDGDNKRLNKLTAEYEACVARLRRADEMIETLLTGTNRMIEAFEDAERGAVQLIESLEPGSGRDDTADGASPSNFITGAKISEYILNLPPPILGPHFNTGPMGPAPEWLAQLLIQRRRTIKGGLSWQNLV